MGHQASNDWTAVGKLYECIWDSARRANAGTSLAFQKIEAIVAESFSAVVEFVPDYEHAATLCTDVDPIADPMKADLIGQTEEGMRCRCAFRARIAPGAERYITLCLNQASQRIDKPRSLKKLKTGYLQGRELRPNVTIDNCQRSPEGLRNFFEGAGAEPVNLRLVPQKVGRTKGFRGPDQPEAVRTSRYDSVKSPEPLPFAELYALCEKNIPPLLHIRGGFPLCRNLQNFSSSGHELKVGE